jgi:hypothetical protein
VRAAYLRGGGTQAEADAYLAQVPAERTVQWLVELTDREWIQLQSNDGGTPEVGWVGTYTVEGDTVHAVEEAGTCRIDYQVTRAGDRMTVRVVRDTGAPECGHLDLLIQRAMFQASPFSRAG